MANNNKQMVDMPFFELCNQAPTATASLAGMTTSENGTSRYIYYLTSSTFYRYDTYADTWQQLATPTVTPSSISSLRYTMARGTHGRVISATSTTITIPGLRGPLLDGVELTILHGTGKGQTRTLTYVSETIHDAGMITATVSNYLTDSLKKWRVNQWAGYIVGITYGNDVTHYKKVLYNDATTLYVQDSNLMPHDPWNNQLYATATPYTIPVITAGSQAHYVIMSSTFSVDSPWTTTPNATSFFTTNTDGIYLLSGTASAPFFTLQYYDILADQWQTKTVPFSLILSSLTTDATIERTAKLGGAFVTKTGTVSATARTLTDSGLALAYDRYANHRIIITGGTGMGQTRRIVAHTATTFTVEKNWATTPDATSTYEVRADYMKIYMAGNGAAAMYAYNTESDYWTTGQDFDDGLVANIALTYGDYKAMPVNNGVRLAAGVLSINPVPTAGGTGYVIGDVLTISVGGTGAQVRVTSISPGGVITGLELICSGTASGFTTGTGKATTGGTGTGATVEITSVGVTGYITTAANNFLRTGDVVTFWGCTEGAWNTAHTIIGVNGLTTFSVATTATASMSNVAGQSATTLVDPTKNWITNEHVGRLVNMVAPAGSSQIRWITANTATTLTVASWTAGSPGQNKYVIYDSKAFGVDDQFKVPNQRGWGWATGGSTTTLVDSSKNWTPNQWVGYVFKVEAGTGYGSGRISITSNTETTLTFATQSFTPDATTKYEIADAWGLATAVGATTTLTETTTKNWATNQWAGKRIKFLGSTGAGQESTITSNTATVLTFSAVTTAPDATTPYAIYSIPARGQGIEMLFNFGATDTAKKGRYLYLPRGGGSNTLDIYDVTTGRWTYGFPISPQTEGYGLGSSYAYDGADTIYLSRSATGSVIRIFALDINTLKVRGLATTTLQQGSIHIGNFMEVVNSPTDSWPYVYCLQNTGTVMQRALLF